MTLALKLLLGPALVVGASLATRRFGPRVGGVVAGLPAVTGPILIVLALDHGRAFAAEAATGSLLATISLLTFVLAYAFVCRRVGWWWALTVGWTASAFVTAGLDGVHVGPYVALASVVAAALVTLALLPAAPGAPRAIQTGRSWDLAFRGACTLVPILVVTGLSNLLGSHLSGLLGGFPLIAPILAAFTQAQFGGEEALRLLHGLALGFAAYGVFVFVVSVSLRGLSIGLSFLLATLLTFATQGALFLLLWRRAQQGVAETAT